MAEDLPEPGADAGRGKPVQRWVWILGAVAAVALVVVAILLFGGNRPEVTYGQMNRIQPGMSQEQVRGVLGETGEMGSFEDTGGTEWEDCWFYTVVPEPGQAGGDEGEGVVCFQGGTVAFVSTPFFF
jgi:hypothetical protein